MEIMMLLWLQNSSQQTQQGLRQQQRQAAIRLKKFNHGKRNGSVFSGPFFHTLFSDRIAL